MKPLDEMPKIKINEDPNNEKRKQEILDFLACGAEFCELEMFSDLPRTAKPQNERYKYERIIRQLSKETGYGMAIGGTVGRKYGKGLKLFQRDYKLYCQRIEGEI